MLADLLGQDGRLAFPENTFNSLFTGLNLCMPCCFDSMRILDFGCPKSVCQNKIWLGREDSNLRMQVPKTCVLPLDDAPAIRLRRQINLQSAINAGDYPNMLWKYSARERVFAGNTRQVSRALPLREAARADSSSEKNPKTEDPLPDSKVAVAPRSFRKSFASLTAG